MSVEHFLGGGVPSYPPLIGRPAHALGLAQLIPFIQICLAELSRLHLMMEAIAGEPPPVPPPAHVDRVSAAIPR